MTQTNNLEAAFGRAVRERRLELGLSQEKLAEAADLHRTYISQLERGVKSPSLKVVTALANALAIRPHQLLKRTEEIDTDG